jgi:hypothetical protein
VNCYQSAAEMRTDLVRLKRDTDLNLRALTGITFLMKEKPSPVKPTVLTTTASLL